MAKEIKVKVCTNDIEKEITVEAGSTLQEILAQVDSETNVYVAAVVDKRLKELTWKLYKDTTVKYLDIGTPIGHDLYKRSVVLLMLRAAREVLNRPEGDYRIEIMYSLGSGFFCRLVDDEVKVDDDLLSKIKVKMQELVDKDLKIEKKSRSTTDMREEFMRRNLPGKALLLKYRRASRINIYSLDGYEDYYYGYMVPSTGFIKEFDLEKYDDSMDNLYSYLTVQKQIFETAA